MMHMKNYDFTNNWFEVTSKSVWDQFIPQIKPSKILEIGSYEGASACFLIDMLAGDHPLEIHCVDPWQDREHKSENMSEIESRFDGNLSLAVSNAKNSVNLVKHKGNSDHCLSKMLGDGMKNYFDFIYVDGSHQAPDVMCDAVLGFRILKVGGFMAFDDYLWAENLPYGQDPIRCPKPAIDAFTNLYCRKLQIIPAPNMQVYIKKLSD